jgi:hypothetical protein
MVWVTSVGYMAGTFISYRRGDSAGYAGRLHEALERRLGGGQIFRDVDTLQPGQDFRLAIEAHVRNCGVFLTLIGQEWLDTRDGSGRRRIDQEHDYVRLEVATALARPDLVVVPVLVEGASMPAPGDLPEPLRNLAYRHAITVRDETWDADVDRLAALIAGHAGRPAATGAAPSRPLRSRRWIAAAIALVIVGVAGALIALRPATRTNDARSSVEPSTPPVEPAVENAGDDGGRRGNAPPVPAQGSAYAIRIPRLSEISHADLIYTLVSGSVSPQGPTAELRLRMRVSNSGRYDANLWDNSFRLNVDGRLIEPTSGLNEVLAGNSIDDAIVIFDVPSGARDTVLRVSYNNASAAMRLNLTPTGRPPENERDDSIDALSRAVLYPLQRDDRQVLQAGGWNVVLRRAAARRFLNKVRLTFVMQLGNRGRVPRHSGDVVVRLGVGGRMLAPDTAPNEAVERASDVTGDYVFHVPPPTERVTLHVTAGAASQEIAFDLPSPAPPRP